MRKIFISIIGAGLLLFCGVGIACAIPITFSFEGTVSSTNDHGTGLLDGSVVVGTSLFGTYIFDSETPASQVLPQLAVYRPKISEGASFTLTVGNYELNVIDGSYDIQLENDGGSNNNSDKYSVESGIGMQTFSNGVDTFSVGFSLDLRNFNDGTAFSNTNLPTSLDLSLFSGNTILITYWDGMGGSVDINAEISSLTSAPVLEPVIPVKIEIKPGSCPNPLNVKSKGVLPVAVLGTEKFDVTQIDLSTVLLTREGVEGGVAPLRWSYEDVATPFEGEPCECHNLTADGYVDLTLKFDTQKMVTTLKLGEVVGQTIRLTLTGNIKKENENGGTPIMGQDCIWVLK